MRWRYFWAAVAVAYGAIIWGAIDGNPWWFTMILATFNGFSLGYLYRSYRLSKALDELEAHITAEVQHRASGGVPCDVCGGPHERSVH